MLKMLFFFGLLCMNGERQFFWKTKRLSFAESFLTVLESHLLLQTKSLSFAQTFPYCYPKQPFSTLHLPFQCPLTYCPQKIPIFTNQKHFFCTTLSLLLSKAILFCPPPPISTPLNLLFAKNTAVLLMFA